MWIFLAVVTQAPSPRMLTLTEYESDISAGGVRSATFLERDQKVVGELAGGVRYDTTYPAQYQDELTRHLLRAPGRVDVRTDAQAASLLTRLLPTIIWPCSSWA